jgi:hypothetical protein
VCVAPPRPAQRIGWQTRSADFELSLLNLSVGTVCSEALAAGDVGLERVLNLVGHAGVRGLIDADEHVGAAAT